MSGRVCLSYVDDWAWRRERRKVDMVDEQLRGTAYQIGQSVFRVGYGDLTKSSAEVLVSSDDNYLSMGGGVSSSLLRAGGPEVQSHARKLVPLKQGDVAVTTAGLLAAKYIFHAVTIDMDERRYPDPQIIRTLVTRSLELSESLRIRSITYPALGTGVGGFSFQEAAEIMVRTIADRLAGDAPVEEVNLALWRRDGVSEDDLNIFYQRAVALASLGGQSQRLGQAVKSLEEAVGEAAQPEFKRKVHDLLSEISSASAVLQERPYNVEEIERLQRESRVASVGRQAVELTESEASASRWQNRLVETTALQTRLEGLSTLLNVHYGSLNRLEIERARYAGVGVPVVLENQISEVTAEIQRVEDLMRDTRSRMARFLEERGLA
jgi:O-acetyl-ADP-ribose deacetylase (regulator of RNase III)